MVKLVSETGHWALRDNSMIFCNIIWEGSYNDCLKYHLIDDAGNELPFNLGDWYYQGLGGKAETVGRRRCCYRCQHN